MKNSFERHTLSGMIRLLSLLLLVCFTVGLYGCSNPYPYGGQYIELYTAAVCSIPDAEGFMHHGEGAFTSDIYVWEQDDYGRTLFSYCEDYGDRTFALVVCQQYDDENVYFYPDGNYVLTLLESDGGCYRVGDDYLKERTEAFYAECKDTLKAANDWNEPLDLSKCVTCPITDHKDLGEDVRSLSSSECDDILNDYTKTLHLLNTEECPHRYNEILQVDAEGRILHEIRGVHQHYDNPHWSKGDKFTYYDIILWVITDKEGNYDKKNGVKVMLSKADCPDSSFIYSAEEIASFKAANGWKYPD